MPKEYSERFLQDKVIELFKKMGYKYLSREEAFEERGNNKGNVLLKNILENKMNEFNYFVYDDKKYKFSEENISRVIELIKSNEYLDEALEMENKGKLITKTIEELENYIY